jgi:hypothetical protein
LQSVPAHVRLGRIREGRHALLARPALGLRQQLSVEPTNLGQGQRSDLVAMGQHPALEDVQLHGFSRSAPPEPTATLGGLAAGRGPTHITRPSFGSQAVAPPPGSHEAGPGRTKIRVFSAGRASGRHGSVRPGPSAGRLRLRGGGRSNRRSSAAGPAVRPAPDRRRRGVGRVAAGRGSSFSIHVRPCFNAPTRPSPTRKAARAAPGRADGAAGSGRGSFQVEPPSPRSGPLA